MYRFFFIFLTGHKNGDATITTLLERVAVHIIPVVNADWDITLESGCHGDPTSQLYDKFTDQVRLYKHE